MFRFYWCSGSTGHRAGRCRSKLAYINQSPDAESYRLESLMHQTSIKVCAPAHAECRGSKPEHPRGCRRQCPPRVGCLASRPEPIVQSLCLVIPPTFFGSRCMRVASLSHICPLSPTAPEPTDHISPQGHIVQHQSRTHQGYKEATVSPDSRDQPSFPLPTSHSKL